MLRVGVFLLVAVLSGVALGQRHGRADSVQNYYSSQRIPNPILNIDTKATNKTWQYFRGSALLKMNRTAFEVTDPKTHSKNVYEGVSLQELVPGSRDSFLQVYSDRSFRDKRVALDPSLSKQSEVLVADTMDGKRLSGDHPYCLIIRNGKGDQIIVKNLSFIRLAP
jgi:hypothetical protein